MLSLNVDCPLIILNTIKQMETKESVARLKQIAVEIKRFHPRLSEYECLTLATRIQQNEIFRQAIVLLKHKIY